MGNECHKQITARKEICDTWENLWILGNKAIVQHLIINVLLTFTSKENTFLIKCKKQLITASFLCCLFLKCVALDLEILHPTCSWNETCGTFLIWSGFFLFFFILWRPLMQFFFFHGWVIFKCGAVQLIQVNMKHGSPAERCIAWRHSFFISFTEHSRSRSVWGPSEWPEGNSDI